MKKIDIPKHIDFQPAKEFKNRFERNRDGFLLVPDWGQKESKICGICGKSFEYRLKINYEDKTCRHD